MWCPEGYITLLEVKEFVDAYAQRQFPDLEENQSAIDPSIYGEADAYSDWLFLSFLIVYSDRIRIALPSGNVIRVVSESFHPEPAIDGITFDLHGIGFSLSPEDWESTVRTYRAFPNDTTGRMKAADYSIRNVDIATMTFAVGRNQRPRPRAEEVVDGLPLCIKLEALPITVNLLVAEIETKIGAFWNASEGNVILPEPAPLHRQIVDALKDGTINKKADAKQRFAQGMKVETFRAIWRQVAAEVPEASKPGPRPTSGNR